MSELEPSVDEISLVGRLIRQVGRQEEELDAAAARITELEGENKMMLQRVIHDAERIIRVAELEAIVAKLVAASKQAIECFAEAPSPEGCEDCVAELGEAIAAAKPAAYAQEIASLTARVAELEGARQGIEEGIAKITAERDTGIGLLKLAKCPNERCDGNGTAWDIEAGPQDEPQQVPVQCQWCDQRTRAIAKAKTD